jgi:hypothetical protein
LKLKSVKKHDMTLDENEVLEICLIYEQEYKKLFKNENYSRNLRRNSLPLKGDPRNSSLFKYCWKLRRETRGLIDKSEYRNYIYANIFIVKINNGNVEPICINGDKAWIRYKVWKRRYDEKISELNCQVSPPSIKTTNPKIIIEIDKNRKFLFEKCEGQPSFEKILKFIEGGYFKIWVATNKISPYYLALSPFILKSNYKDSLFSICSSSESLILEKITEEIKNYFKHEYNYEF